MDDAFGHWLAGFIDGEGYFGIVVSGREKRSWGCRFTIGLRADDAAILQECHKQTGLGWLTSSPSRDPRWGPQWQWTISSKKDCIALMRLLERYPLRAKKAADFAVWREAVRCWAALGRGRPNPAASERMAELRAVLDGMRRWSSETPAHQTLEALNSAQLRLTDSA